MIRIGATGLNGYVSQLLEDLRYYHRTGIMPEDVRAAYERKIGTAYTDDSFEDICLDDGSLDNDFNVEDFEPDGTEDLSEIRLDDEE
jgi:hypothetical protein